MSTPPLTLPIRLDANVSRTRDGALLGGAPPRLLRLSPLGQAQLPDLGRARTPDTTAGARLARRLVECGLAHPEPPPFVGAPEVTVVIPVRDRATDLDRCLSGLAGAFPVVVVDDGSRSAVAIGAVAARHGARLIRRPVAGGPAAARNAGLSQVETTLVAFLDSDVQPDGGWIGELAGHFDDPQVGAVAPRVRAAPPVGGRAVSGPAVLLRSPLDLGTRPCAVRPGARVAYLPSAALLVRRDALAGGFDVRLRYGEDVDFVWRLHDRGLIGRYDPRASVTHREPARLGAALRRRFEHGTSAGPLAQRHPGRVHHAVLTAAGASSALALLLGWPRAAAAILGASAVRRGVTLRHLGIGLPDAVREAAIATGRELTSAAVYPATFAPLIPAIFAIHRRRATPLALLAVSAWSDRADGLGLLATSAGLPFGALARAAYGGGVIAGCARTRTLEPLRVRGLRRRRAPRHARDELPPTRTKGEQ